MFDHAIDKRQRPAELLLRHIAGRGRVQRLVQLDKTLFHMTKHSSQNFAVDLLIAISSR